MNSPTRLEVDAAIHALDERYERRFDRLEARIDALIRRMDEGFERIDERMARFEERMARFEEQLIGFSGRLDRVEADCRETRRIASSIKQTVITTAVASVIAIVIGFGAITSSMQTSMLNAFSSGQHAGTQFEKNAALQEKMQRQADETDAVLRAIRKDLEARPLNPRPAR